MKNRVIVDVREADEFKQEHVPNSINIPLSQIAQVANYKAILNGKETLIMCKSGRRAGMAKESFDAHNIVCEVYQGGIDQWKKEQKDVNTTPRKSISIFRQVQIIIGFLVAIFATLGMTVNPSFTWVAALFGLALGVAGLFGFCLLAELLHKMPWNRAQS